MSSPVEPISVTKFTLSDRRRREDGSKNEKLDELRPNRNSFNTRKSEQLDKLEVQSRKSQDYNEKSARNKDSPFSHNKRKRSKSNKFKKSADQKQLDTIANQALKKSVNLEFALSNDFLSTDSEHEERIRAVEDDLTKYSLIIKDRPGIALKLMLYLKHYSELLFSWGETFKAISVSKIASNAYKLVQLFHPQQQTKEHKIKLYRKDLYHNVL